MDTPFGELRVDISPSELRETAYEILIGACRSSGSGRRLTYVSSSNSKESARQLSPSPSMQRPVSSAASKVKKALGLKSKRKKSDEDGSGDPARKMAVGELMRVQMRVSEQTDSRVRRGFLRVAAGQVRNLAMGIIATTHVFLIEIENKSEWVFDFASFAFRQSKYIVNSVLNVVLEIDILLRWLYIIVRVGLA